MEKGSKGDIAIKIGALLSFGVMVGGGFLAIGGLSTENWVRAIVGGGVGLLGIFLTAVLAQWIALSGAETGVDGLTVSDSLKGGALFTFFAAFLLFAALGIYFWVQKGYWQMGVCGIASLVMMILLAVVISVAYQTGLTKKALSDPDAIEEEGTIGAVRTGLRVRTPLGAKLFFYEYTVNVWGDSRSVAYLAGRDGRCKQLKVGDRVIVKINPEKPKYCAIIDPAPKTERSR